MAVVSVREYEPFWVGKSCDPGARTVTQTQRDYLERFNETRRKRFRSAPFQYGPRGSLVAQNYVGLVDLGGDQVEVLPKIDCGSADVRRNLARMLCVALGVDARGEDGTAVHATDSILEVLVQLFCNQLWAALHKGMVKRYEPMSETLAVLRGRLNVVRQMRQNLLRPDRLACDYDEFTEDNALNQVLKAALNVLVRVAQRSNNLRSLGELLLCMEDVTDVPARLLRWRQASTDRLSARYRPLLAMAELFLNSASPDVLSGSNDGFALMFDMNQLFEEYVGRTLQRHLARPGLHITRQGPSRYLARNTAGKPVFQLQPDVVACDEVGVPWVVDTKWKRLDLERAREGVSSSDIYQMVAYARQYHAVQILLLYPHHSELGKACGLRDRFSLESTGSDASRHSVSVGTLDLRDLATVPMQLRVLLEPMSDAGALAALEETVEAGELNVSA